MLSSKCAALWLTTIVWMWISTESCNFMQSDNAWASKRLFTLYGHLQSPCSSLSAGHIPAPSNVAHMFVFHKDEHELLADWLQYHTYLFGFQNIHVVDNDSENPQICKLLAMYKYCGVEVVNYKGEFSNKHVALTQLMLQHKNNTFLIPVDADEFVTFPIAGIHTLSMIIHNKTAPFFDFTNSRELIHTEIQKLPRDGVKFKFQCHPVQYYVQDCQRSTKQDIADPDYRRVTAPGCAGASQYKLFMLKTFFHSDGFISTGKGNHEGVTVKDGNHTNARRDAVVLSHLNEYYHFTNVTLLHYYSSSYRTMRQKYLRGAHAYNYTQSTDCNKVTKGGSQYCFLAKSYVKYDRYSRDYYVRNCQYPGDPRNSLYQLTSFTAWMIEHLKPFAELIGETLTVTDLL